MNNSPLPWCIDQDNSEGIVIVADNGDIVHAVYWADVYDAMPEERGSGFAEDIIKTERANAYFVLSACNSHAELINALEAVLVMYKGGSKPRKLDEALTWRENDEYAMALADSALKLAKA